MQLKSRGLFGSGRRRPLYRFLLLSFLFIPVVATGVIASATSSGRQIWFTMPNFPGPGQQDWAKLFGQPDTEWPTFLNNVQVFAATGVDKIPDPILSVAFRKLNQKHLSFAIDSLAQSWVNQPQCGHGVESYTDPPGHRKLVAKIKANGGRLVYIAMDEPLYFGHYYGGHDACHSSIENVAERAAAVMREYKNQFPGVIIGDIEPFPALTQQPGWQNDYKAWMGAFQSVMGQPIAFLHVDINWAKPGWQASVQQASNFAHASQLQLGIIYNGNVHGDPAPTSQKWIDSAAQHYNIIEKPLGVVPDQVIFHSWEKYPTRVLSDPDEPGLDTLVMQYIQAHPN